ncbi:MAG: hypothetical protein EOO12_13230, partial [Chitinophagaceae bacterium]
MTLLLSLRSEFRKTKRTASWPFALLAAAFVPVLFLLSGAGTDGINPDTIKDPWGEFFNKGFMVFGGAVLPLFIILCGTLLPQVEYRNDTWKQVRITPQSPALLFTAKYTQYLLLLLLVQVTFNLLMFAAAGILHWRQPLFGFGAHPLDWMHWLGLNSRLSVAILGLSSMHFWLGLRARNFLLPVGVGLALWFMSLYVLFEGNSALTNYLPQAYPMISVLKVPA